MAMSADYSAKMVMSAHYPAKRQWYEVQTIRRKINGNGCKLIGKESMVVSAHYPAKSQW